LDALAALELIALIVTGGLAGWIAGRLLRGEGYGFVINVAVGVVGGIVGGKLLALFRVTPDDWLIELAVAVAGAVLLLALVRREAPSEG
jgi:uncharacterized membrane protein YeaQ/YmgE (transglycosylase-associated protein family)